MITAQEIIKEAETWIGTKYMRKGRIKGVGVDCCGLIIEVARYLNITKSIYVDYRRRSDPDMIWDTLRKHMIEVDKENLMPGTVLLMEFCGVQYHLAIFDGENIIHASIIEKKVAKHRLDSEWKASVCGVFKFIGVQY